MPKLTGLSVNEAKALLKARGITVPVVVKSGKNYSTVSKGKVDSQLPEKGQTLISGGQTDYLSKEQRGRADTGAYTDTGAKFGYNKAQKHEKEKCEKETIR